LLELYAITSYLSITYQIQNLELQLIEIYKSQLTNGRIDYCKSAQSRNKDSKPYASFRLLAVFNGQTINILRNNRYKNNKTSYLCKSFFGILT